eukprot:gene17314-35726_t
MFEPPPRGRFWAVSSACDQSEMGVIYALKWVAAVVQSPFIPCERSARNARPSGTSYTMQTGVPCRTESFDAVLAAVRVMDQNLAAFVDVINRIINGNVLPMKSPPTDLVLILCSKSPLANLFGSDSVSGPRSRVSGVSSKILEILATGQRSMGDLITEGGFSSASAFLNLKKLKEQGAVQSERAGRSVNYSLADASAAVSEAPRRGRKKGWRFQRPSATLSKGGVAWGVVTSS